MGENVKKSGLNFYNYVVGFVDLLGQRDEFKGQGLLPQFKTTEEYDAFKDKVRRTIGAIDDLQQASDQFLDAAREYGSPLKDSLPENMQDAYEESRKHKLQKQNWSDGLVYFTSVGDEEIKVPMNAVFGIMSSLGSMSLLGLAKKRPIRGGVEVAWGVELRPGEIYGCAVAKAYELESEVAQYPRVVLGPYTLDYLQKTATDNPKSVFDSLNQRLAQVCIEMLAEDMDGYPFIDYLGPGFRKFITKENHALLYGKALEYVAEQLEYHREQKNTKLVLRYHHLHQYFVDHRPDEEVQPEKGSF